jgi:hypothetical protein
MKNLLFHLKAVKSGTLKAKVGARAVPVPEPERNFLKAGAGAGAETNSIGSATLPGAE